MPRAHRRRPQAVSDDISHILRGIKRQEIRRGVQWWVQHMSESQAQKEYICPGCALQIPAGMAHVVTWRSDGILGDEADLRDRRHWHNSCWKVS